MLAFSECEQQFQDDLVAVCNGDIEEARECYEIVAKDGWLPAYYDAYKQKHLKLPKCEQQPVASLTSEGRTLAESIVARAVEFV
jgi:hypothetical protein